MKEVPKMGIKKENTLLTADKLSQMYHLSVELFKVILSHSFEKKKHFLRKGKYYPLVLKMKNKTGAFFVLNNKEEAIHTFNKLYNLGNEPQQNIFESSSFCMDSNTPMIEEEKQPTAMYPKMKNKITQNYLCANPQDTIHNNILKKTFLSIQDLNEVFSINKSSFDEILQELFEKEIFITEKNKTNYPLVKKTPEDITSRFHLYNSKQAQILFSKFLAQKGIFLTRNTTSFKIKKILEREPFPTKKMLSELVSIYSKED